MSGNFDISRLAIDACSAVGNEPSALIEVLHEVYRQRGEIVEADLVAIADALNLSRAEVYGVKSFYRDLQQPRRDRTIVQICLGEACRACGAGELFKHVQPQLEAGGIAAAVPVYCLGNCALSPAVMVDDIVHGRADAESVFLLAAGVAS